MRQVGTLTTQHDAERFADYLVTLGVASRVDATADGFHVWAIDENEVARAKQALSEFQANPADPRYATAQATAEKLRQRQAAERRRAQRNYVDFGQRWRQSPAGQIPLTVALIGISVAVTLLTDFSTRPELARWLILSNSGMRLSELWHGQLWRLWTPMFLHAGWFHLFFNMYWIYLLGSAIEIRKGTWALAGLILACQLAASVGQILIGQPGFVGISGAVYGLFGYVWMKSRFDPAAGFYLDPMTVVIMIAWLFLASRMSDAPIANMAHFGGLVAGVALGYPWARMLR